MNRVYRSNTDKIIAGVCGGLGEYLHIDPLILRIGFVLLAMLNGVGVIVYLILWVMTPVAQTETLNQDEIVRRNVEEMREHARTLGQEARTAFNQAQGEQTGNRMLVGGIILVGIGLLFLLNNLGLFWWFRLGKLWPLILIALGGVILLNNLKGKR